MPALAILGLGLLLAATLGDDGPRTVWEDEEAAREAALVEAGLDDDVEADSSAPDDGEQA